MYRGFPLSLLSTLRCPQDRARLRLTGQDQPPAHIQQGILTCSSCGATFRIDAGILRFLDVGALDSDSNRERIERDREATTRDPSWERAAWSQMEVLRMTAACEPLAGALVLELGAGTGRHTAVMAGRGAAIVAVDFSITSLEKIAQRAEAEWDVGLVHADCTRLAPAPGSFDLVVSTLISNLPTPQHRAATMQVAAEACKTAGRFVFGTHHYGVRARLHGEAKSGLYDGAPIYRYMFDRREIELETRRFFDDISCTPIQIMFPLAQRLHLPVVKLSRVAERLPLVNQLAALLLITARAPTHARSTPAHVTNAERVY